MPLTLKLGCQGLGMCQEENRGFFEYGIEQNNFFIKLTEFKESLKINSQQCESILDFLEKHYRKVNGKFLMRGNEKNLATENSEPTINHSIKVAENLIDYIIEGEESLTKKDTVQKYKDIYNVKNNITEAVIAALLHDVIEDEVGTEEEIQKLLKEIQLPEEKISRIFKILEFLTKMKDESCAEYIQKIENAKSKNNIAATIAQFIKIADIVDNSLSPHTDKQKEKYTKFYMKYLLERFPWIYKIIKKGGIVEYMIEQNPYLKNVIKEIISKQRKEIVNQLLKKFHHYLSPFL